MGQSIPDGSDASDDVPDDVPDDASDAGVVTDLLHQVNHRIRRVAAAEFEPLGVTGSQIRALRTLARCDRPMRMSELAATLGIVRRSATSVVDELEQRGLVTRAPAADDRRGVGVTLTPTGTSLLDEVRGRQHVAAEQVLGHLERAELRRLRQLLEQLLA